MSFVLPRNAPKLTFTGSLRALGRKRTPPARPDPAQDVYLQEHARTPYIGSRPSMAAEAAMRPRMDSYDDQMATVALHRDDFEQARRARQPDVKKGALPVFNFQRAADPIAPAAIRISPRKKSTQRSPLMTVIWLMASVLAAMGSYKYAPEMLESVHDAARVLSSQ
jgi:hypothetical protein